MNNIKPLLLPFPKKINFFEGNNFLKNNIRISIASEGKEQLFNIALKLKKVLVETVKEEVSILADKRGDIIFLYDERLSEEAYTININMDCIEIAYSNYAGAFYAVSTLKQLLYEYGRKIPCMFIEDKPDYKRRGMMLDISRGKIPTMETLYKIIDFMSDVKLNELQLYIEGFSFAYDSFPQVWSNGTPVTPEEIMLLDKYCRERYIDLVPNQNSFGHMSAWLNRKEFHHLADCKEGCLTPWGVFTRNSTLNPLDEGSIELIRKQYDDLLPNFTSDYFNVGLDEPFELGYGKSKEEVAKLGEGRVYLNYLLKIYNEVSEKKKKMMFWGDIIIKSPELINELPKDIIALEWGYEADHPFEENCIKYKDSGIDFYVCPGTSSWCSILGRTENMKKNLLNAAESGLKNGAVGYLNTDWGDLGHIQYLLISYPGFCYGAALSWGVENNKEADVAGYLNKFIFKDINEIIGQLIMDMGNYYLEEDIKVSNSTKLFKILNCDIKNMHNVKNLNVENYEGVEKYLNSIDERLNEVYMICEDREQVLAELKNSIKYVLHGVKRVKLMLASSLDRKVNYDELIEDIESIMKNHSELWLKRNRVGGMEHSLEYMRRLRKQYK